MERAAFLRAGGCPHCWPTPLDTAAALVVDEARSSFYLAHALPVRLHAAVAVYERTRVRGSDVPTDHPEAICQRCGRLNTTSWSAPSDLWNRVVGDRWSVLCPPCFTELADPILGGSLGYVVWDLRPREQDR